MHDFVVVDSLVTPVILGIDFLPQNGLVLDFTCTPVMVREGHVTAGIAAFQPGPFLHDAIPG